MATLQPLSVQLTQHAYYLAMSPNCSEAREALLKQIPTYLGTIEVDSLREKFFVSQISSSLEALEDESTDLEDVISLAHRIQACIHHLEFIKNHSLGNFPLPPPPANISRKVVQEMYTKAFQDPQKNLKPLLTVSEYQPLLEKSQANGLFQWALDNFNPEILCVMLAKWALTEAQITSIINKAFEVGRFQSIADAVISYHFPLLSPESLSLVQGWILSQEKHQITREFNPFPEGVKLSDGTSFIQTCSSLRKVLKVDGNLLFDAISQQTFMQEFTTEQALIERQIQESKDDSETTEALSEVLNNINSELSCGIRQKLDKYLNDYLNQRLNPKGTLKGTLKNRKLGLLKSRITALFSTKAATAFIHQEFNPYIESIYGGGLFTSRTDISMNSCNLIIPANPKDAITIVAEITADFDRCCFPDSTCIELPTPLHLDAKATYSIDRKGNITAVAEFTLQKKALANVVAVAPL